MNDGDSNTGIEKNRGEKMEIAELEKNLCDFRDLQARWGYQSVQGVRKRAQYDRKFPKPVKITGNKTQLFWLPHIEAYEKMRGGIDLRNNRFCFYQTREEWEALPEEERQKRENYFFKDL